jgi:hypothetical protein
MKNARVKKHIPVNRPRPASRFRRVIMPEVRFEFQIPEGVPKDKMDMYVWEKLKNVCRGLSRNGMKVTPVVPPEYADNLNSGI